MHNINDAIATLRDAETVIASTLLNEEEKAQLVRQLASQVPDTFHRFPHVATIVAALGRVYPSPREAEGIQEPPAVDAPAAEAPEGPSEGESEQDQDAGDMAGGIAVHRTTSATPAAPEKRPKAKARK